MFELGKFVADEKESLNELATGLAGRDRVKVAAALAALPLALATGHPELAGLLSPFLTEGVRRAFASTATARLEKAWAQTKSETETAKARSELIAELATAVEALLGQALIQVARVQHRTKDEVVEALGGLRQEFESFREQFQDRLDDDGIRIDLQRVRDGAVGIRLSDGARAIIRVSEMTVSGAGSVGIDVRRT